MPVGREDAGFFASPIPTEERLRFLLALIARSARVSIGFEEVAGTPRPFDGNLEKIPESARTPLIGLTAGAALDALVAADRRYSWREQDGVLVIRPLEAWTQTDHFLDRSVAALTVKGEIGDAARSIYALLGIPTIFAEGGVLGDPPPDAALEKPLDIAISRARLMGALNGIVRVHGSAGWMVHYARAPATIQNSCLRFISFEGRFTGLGAAACQSTAGVGRE
jgi:hypothetical protein